MTIHRQHSDTEIIELYDRKCERLIAVVNRNMPFTVSILYTMADDIWHRFFIDAGLLFWSEGQNPDEDEDIGTGEEYTDIGLQLGVIGKSFKKICMTNGELTISFNNGAKIVLKEDEDEVRVTESKPKITL